MLTIFTGNDSVAIQNALAKALETEKNNLPDLEVIQIEENQYIPGLVYDLVESQSLFNIPRAYIFERILGNSEFWKEFTSAVDELVSSNEFFFLIEPKLLAAEKKFFSSDLIQEYKEKSASSFNPFAIAEAFLNKDRRTMWLVKEEAKQLGVPAEELIGILWWQLKILLLAKKTKTAGAAGVKDYPYNKAKRGLANFKEGEIELAILSLFSLYHDGHAGLCDIDTALEIWILNGGMSDQGA